MDMTGEQLIPAPRMKVWEALNDPQQLKQAIPGCQTVDKTSDTEFTATVVAKVGPVSATFKGKVTLSNLRPGEGYSITGEGAGGAAGFGKGGAEVTLEDAPGGGTLLKYSAHASVGGKLAQIGSRLIEGTVNQTAEQFFSRFGALVSAGSESAAAPAEATPAQPAPAKASGSRTWIWIAAAVVVAAIVVIVLVT